MNQLYTHICPEPGQLPAGYCIRLEMKTQEWHHQQEAEILLLANHFETNPQAHIICETAIRQMAKNLSRNFFQDSPTGPLANTDEQTSIQEILYDSLANTNSYIHQLLNTQKEALETLGLLAVVVVNDHFHWISIGDVSLMHKHQNKLHQISPDHSLAQIMHAGGTEDNPEAPAHKPVSLICFLGMKDLPSLVHVPLSGQAELTPGDLLLLSGKRFSPDRLLDINQQIESVGYQTKEQIDTLATQLQDSAPKALPWVLSPYLKPGSETLALPQTNEHLVTISELENRLAEKTEIARLSLENKEQHTALLEERAKRLEQTTQLLHDTRSLNQNLEQENKGLKQELKLLQNQPDPNKTLESRMELFRAENNRLNRRNAFLLLGIIVFFLFFIAEIIWHPFGKQPQANATPLQHSQATLIGTAPPSTKTEVQSKPIDTIQIPTKKQVETTRHDCIYIVQKGEWIARIARKFNLSINDIKTYNHFKADQSLYPGDTIRIPLQGR